jgi:hypothetical protein
LATAIPLTAVGIAGVKSILTITDMFGDKIINLKWAFDEGAMSRSLLNAVG